MKSLLYRALLCAALLVTISAARATLAADELSASTRFYEAKTNNVERIGWITALLPKPGIVVVKPKEGNAIKVTLAKDCLFFTKQKKEAATLTDFKVGEEVRLLFTPGDNIKICHALWEPGAEPGQKEQEAQKQAR